MDYPGLKSRWQVSTQGGIAPRWRRDGGEILFLDLDTRMMSVKVTASENALTLGLPSLLFPTEMSSHAQNRVASWDVDAKGERFFMLEPAQQAEERPPLTLVRGWSPPTKRN